MSAATEITNRLDDLIEDSGWGNSYYNCDASETNNISNEQGVLVAIVINTDGGAVTVYDNARATGTTIADVRFGITPVAEGGLGGKIKNWRRNCQRN